VTTIVVGSFLISIFAAYILWREAFTVVLAVGGLVGALVILYEVRLTKRIAQAEFIRDLNDGFTTNASIDELWRKLLLGEEVTGADRHLVSTYLTFFETVQLLLNRGVIDFTLIDNLFRNRFFTAIGNPGVQSTALIRDGGSFYNIHVLIRSWREHLRSAGVRLPEGYYSYVRATAAFRGYAIEPLEPLHLDEVMGLQAEVMAGLGHASWLRENNAEMFEACLAEHDVIGAWKDDRLVGAAILYHPGAGPESIKKYVSTNDSEITEAVNLKLVLVAPSEQRSALGSSLVELLEQRALALGKREILCTVHPANRPSHALFSGLGYQRQGRVTTSYGVRDVLARVLPKPTQSWVA